MDYTNNNAAINYDELSEEEYRICTVCGRKMVEGYIVEENGEYFCSDDCLHAYYSEQEYKEMCEEDRAYWTQWI